MITETAPAKINLYLHVLGKRADGYHRLDSLVVFAPQAADRVTLKEANAYSLHIEGPEAGGLNSEDAEKNLITRALRRAAAKTGKAMNFSIMLEKHLPVASGIGGGSADAAAALRAAATFWKLPKDDARLMEAAKETGADVPACLLSAPCYFGGIGDEIAKAPALPSFYMVLVNPHIPLPTPEVFRVRQGAFNKESRFEKTPADVEGLVALLKERRNDLQEAAIGLCAAIEHAIGLLEAQAGCLLARMSGSGATCFGIFKDKTSAEAAVRHIKSQIREYWVAVSEI